MATVEAWLVILELDPPCDMADVKKARKRLARRFHPDVAGEAGDEAGKHALAEKMKAVNAAADSLIVHIERHGPVGSSYSRAGRSGSSTRSRSGDPGSGGASRRPPPRPRSQGSPPPRQGPPGGTEERARAGQRRGRSSNRREEEKQRADEEHARRAYQKYRETKFAKGGTRPKQPPKPPSPEAERAFRRFKAKRTRLVEARTEWDLATQRIEAVSQDFGSGKPNLASLWGLYSMYFEWLDSLDGHRYALRALEAEWVKSKRLLIGNRLVSKAEWKDIFDASQERSSKRSKLRRDIAGRVIGGLDDLAETLATRPESELLGEMSRTLGALLHLRAQLEIESDVDEALSRLHNGGQRTHPPVRIGRVVKVVQGRGFAFIREIGSDAETFVHATQFRNGDFTRLETRSLVTYRTRPSPKGPQACEAELAPGT